MNSSFDWCKYNADRNKEAAKINKFNLNSNFNYSEKGIYNHITGQRLLPNILYR